MEKASKVIDMVFLVVAILSLCEFIFITYLIRDKYYRAFGQTSFLP